METIKKPKRSFTAEQKLAILRAIEADRKGGMKLTDALEKNGIVSSLHTSWSRKLAVGVKSSLRSGKPPVNKELKQLERKVAKLESIILSQSQQIADLKKETNWD